jgi:antirestriction protein
MDTLRELDHEWLAGMAVEAYEMWVSHHGYDSGNENARRDFDAAYRGSYDSAAQFAAECVHKGMFGHIDHALVEYLDFERIADDMSVLFIDGSDGVHVFDCEVAQ